MSCTYISLGCRSSFFFFSIEKFVVARGYQPNCQYIRMLFLISLSLCSEMILKESPYTHITGTFSEKKYIGSIIFETLQILFREHISQWRANMISLH